MFGVFSCKLCRARSDHFISCSLTDSVDPPLSCSASGSSLFQKKRLRVKSSYDRLRGNLWKHNTNKVLKSSNSNIFTCEIYNWSDYLLCKWGKINNLMCTFHCWLQYLQYAPIIAMLNFDVRNSEGTYQNCKYEFSPVGSSRPHKAVCLLSRHRLWDQELFISLYFTVHDPTLVHNQKIKLR